MNGSGVKGNIAHRAGEVPELDAKCKNWEQEFQLQNWNAIGPWNKKERSGRLVKQGSSAIGEPTTVVGEDSAQRRWW